MNEVLKSITERRSIRSFSSEQVKEEDLTAILEAGRSAPSSKNGQPWHFTVVQKKELLDKIVKENKEIVLANPELLAINKWMNVPNYDNFYNAPTVIFISGDTNQYWNVCDCALAMQNMSLAAHSLGLGTCIVASVKFLFDAKTGKYNKEFGLPHGYKTLFALSLGYSKGESAKSVPRKADFVNYIR